MVNLSGENISLSQLRVSDAEKLAEWIEDLEVTLPLGDEAYSTVPVETIRRDIEKAAERSASIRAFAIIENETNCLVGRCVLFGIDHVNRSAKTGLFIGEKQCWGRGYGREALRLILDYAFHLLNLHSVMLGTFSFNIRALKCYESVGFKEIGRIREARIIGQERYDVILMDILADEFRQRYQSIVLGYLKQ